MITNLSSLYICNVILKLCFHHKNLKHLLRKMWISSRLNKQPCWLHFTREWDEIEICRSSKHACALYCCLERFLLEGLSCRNRLIMFKNIHNLKKNSQKQNSKQVKHVWLTKQGLSQRRSWGLNSPPFKMTSPPWAPKEMRLFTGVYEEPPL